MRFNRALIPALLVWAVSFAAQAQPAPVSDADKAPTILACSNAGQTAIRDLRACAGAWLTPRALLLCALQNTGNAGPIACPFLPDTPDGRAILDVPLAQEHLRATAIYPWIRRTSPVCRVRRRGHLQQNGRDAGRFPCLRPDFGRPDSNPGTPAMYQDERVGQWTCLVSCQKRDGRSGPSGQRQMFRRARRGAGQICILPG